MTEVAFHFNVPDKLSYACRLLRKATASGARAVVTGDAAQLGELDSALWTFSALEFIAHCTATAEASVRDASPVVLAESVAQAPAYPVLVNLGEPVPEGFERFERLIELVGCEDTDRASARARWKHYAQRGYAIVRHDVATQP